MKMNPLLTETLVSGFPKLFRPDLRLDPSVRVEHFNAIYEMLCALEHVWSEDRYIAGLSIDESSLEISFDVRRLHAKL